jgi:hypothetical protein
MGLELISPLAGVVSFITHSDDAPKEGFDLAVLGESPIV